MLRGRFVVVAIVAVLVSTAAAAPPNGDAGSGGDAGDTVATATPLPGLGVYQAALDPPGESDWFSLSAEDAGVSIRCAVLHVDGGMLADATLGVVSQGTLETLTSPFSPVQGTTLALALPSISEIVVGTGPNASAPSLAQGDYTFDVAAYANYDLGPADAGTGTDAGATFDTAITPTSWCLKGKLNPGGGDTTDLYALDGESGDRLVYSVGGGSYDLTVDLIDPTGTSRASAAPGDVLDVVLDRDGTWYISVTQPGGGALTYVIGLVGPGEEPDPGPCRPGCF